MNDIKCESDAHVWCKSIGILKTWVDFLNEWNERKAFHFPRLNEYHGCMVESILKSHEIFVLNDILRGMYSISPGKASINKWKRKWARMVCCQDKRQMIMPWGSHKNDFEQSWVD